jgi:hypothetical protein
MEVDGRKMIIDLKEMGIKEWVSKNGYQRMGIKEWVSKNGYQSDKLNSFHAAFGSSRVLVKAALKLWAP